MVDFRLKVFYTVAGLGSFSKAAQKLHVSQPAVSNQIRSLEEEFETRLLSRGKNKVILTESGQVLYKYAKEILELYEQVGKELGEITKSLERELTIGVTSIPGKYFIPQIIQQFKKKYPEVEIKTLISNTQNIVQSLKENISDVCIVSEPVHGGRLFRQRFLRDELVLIVNPNHRWVEKDFISIEELMREPLVLREEGSGTRETMRHCLKQLDKRLKDFNVIMTLGTTGAIKGAVEKGVGVGFALKCAIQLELQIGSLKIVPIENLQMYQMFSLLYKKNSRKHIANQLIQFIQELDFS